MAKKVVSRASLLEARRRRLYLLGKTRHRQYIARSEAKWFWSTFRALRQSGWDYRKAWDFTVWALEHSYAADL